MVRANGESSTTFRANGERWFMVRIIVKGVVVLGLGLGLLMKMR